MTRRLPKRIYVCPDSGLGLSNLWSDTRLRERDVPYIWLSEYWKLEAKIDRLEMELAEAVACDK